MDTFLIQTHWQIMHRSLPFADTACAGILIGTYEHLSCSHCRKRFVLRPKWTVDGIAAFDIVAAEPRFPATRTLPGVWRDDVTIPIPVCSGCGEHFAEGANSTLRRRLVFQGGAFVAVEAYYCDRCKDREAPPILPAIPAVPQSGC
jgi:hypothetical protein